MSGKQLTAEEEILLNDFSRTVPRSTAILFHLNALFVSALPMWLFWRIQMLDPAQYGIMFAIVTLTSTFLLTLAYKNVKYQLKHKIANRRHAGVTAEVLQQVADAASDKKKAVKKEKDDRILFKKTEVADLEATHFAIFYNNALYLFITLILSFYILKNFSSTVNYLGTSVTSACVVAFLSTGTI